MVQAAATFRKSGFNDQDAATLAEVAATFQNVADTALSADDAAASIISQLRAYGETAEWATHVVDAYNEVANTQAVGTNDLATAMEVASAAMATYGNEFEQVLGLATAGVEVMQGRPAQVARGLSTIAARIVKNQEALAEYGITVEDANGNLKSTYDVLSELKPKWDEMTDAQRTALGDTIAGTNQYKVLASVMSNFDSAVIATETAYNSAGSAAQENSRYMESLEAQTNQLKSTFQDFANNVITKEMISSVLNLANAFLELLNTPFGQFATRVVLVTTALTGLRGILDQYMKFMKLGAFGGVLSKLNTGFGILTSAIDGNAMAMTQLTGGLKAFLATAGPAVAIFTALAVAIKLGTAKFDAYNEAVENTATAQEKLGSYKDELADLESRTDTLTEAERHRLDVLREITAEQEKQVRAAKQAEYEAYSEAYGSGAGVATGTTGTGSGGIGGWGRVETVQRDVYQLTEYQRQLNDLQQQYANQAKDSAMSTGEYYAALQDLNDGYAETIEKLRDFIEAGIEVTDSERALVMAYDEAQSALGNVGTSIQIVTDAYTQLTNSGEISKATWETLIAYYPQLADGAVQTANGYQIQQSALENLMSAESRQIAQAQNVVSGFIAEAQQAGYTGQAIYNYASSLITASNTGLSVSQQIAALQVLAQQAGYTAQAIAQVFAYANAMGTYQADTDEVKNLASKLLNSGQASSVSQAFNMAKQQLTQQAWGNLTSNYQPTISVPSVSVPSVGNVGTGGSSSSSRRPSSTKTGTSTDNSRQKEAQAEIKRLQNEQDAIQDQIDAVNEKYDKQLEELEAINDAIEDQIELERLLNNLAAAKSKKVMVFKDGRFQYLDDIEEVSKAQQDLEDYYNRRDLAAQKKKIEQDRQNELKLLQQEKKYLEDRIKYWRNLSSELSYAYDSDLNYLGGYVDSANSFYQTDLDNLGAYVNAKQQLINQANNAKLDTSTGNDIDVPMPDTPTPSQIKQNEKIAANYPANKGYSSENNSQYDSSTIANIQAWYGTSADGVWGKNSYAAAGNRNIDSAAGLYYKIRNIYDSFADFKAAGGYAVGTLSATSGLHMVGEQGPELRVLNQGDGVIPAKQTARLWSFANDPAKFLQNIANYGGGRSEVINVQNVTLPNVSNAQDFVNGLRNMAYQRAYGRA